MTVRPRHIEMPSGDLHVTYAHYTSFRSGKGSGGEVSTMTKRSNNSHEGSVRATIGFRQFMILLLYMYIMVSLDFLHLTRFTKVT
jgi:hypothetical protein